MRRFGPIVLLRELFVGGRLLIGVTVAVVAFAVLPTTMRLPVRLGAAWVVGVVLFLSLTGLVMVDASAQRMRRRARLLGPSRRAILVIIIAAAGISLIALGVTLQKVPGESTALMAVRLIVAGLAVIASWALMHTTYALHYAHHYYGDGPAPGPDDDRGGLAFPGREAPDYWDFLYFSLVIGMTCQVSDVQITSRAMRRVTLLHSVLSFFFNTIILALAVNLVAGSL